MAAESAGRRDRSTKMQLQQEQTSPAVEGGNEVSAAPDDEGFVPARRGKARFKPADANRPQSPQKRAPTTPNTKNALRQLTKKEGKPKKPRGQQYEEDDILFRRLSNKVWAKNATAIDRVRAFAAIYAYVLRNSTDMPSTDQVPEAAQGVPTRDIVYDLDNNDDVGSLESQLKYWIRRHQATKETVKWRSRYFRLKNVDPDILTPAPGTMAKDWHAVAELKLKLPERSASVPQPVTNVWEERAKQAEATAVQDHSEDPETSDKPVEKSTRARRPRFTAQERKKLTAQCMPLSTPRPATLLETRLMHAIWKGDLEVTTLPPFLQQISTAKEQADYEDLLTSTIRGKLTVFLDNPLPMHLRTRQQLAAVLKAGASGDQREIQTMAKFERDLVAIDGNQLHFIVRSQRALREWSGRALTLGEDKVVLYDLTAPENKALVHKLNSCTFTVTATEAGMTARDILRLFTEHLELNVTSIRGTVSPQGEPHHWELVVPQRKCPAFLEQHDRITVNGNTLRLSVHSTTERPRATRDVTDDNTNATVAEDHVPVWNIAMTQVDTPASPQDQLRDTIRHIELELDRLQAQQLAAQHTSPGTPADPTIRLSSTADRDQHECHDHDRRPAPTEKHEINHHEGSAKLSTERGRRRCQRRG